MTQLNSSIDFYNKHFFFILGSPRSGTKWFSTFFTTEKVFCFHELTLYCHGNVESHVKAIKEYIPIKGDILESTLHRFFKLYPLFGKYLYQKLEENSNFVACGNSDCAIMHIAPALHQIFPNSKYLIILRNGFDVALSLEQKMKEHSKTLENGIEYYNDWLKANGLLVKCKDYFEIACWRWRAYTEKLINNYKVLSKERTLLVSFEKTFKDINNLNYIWDYLLNKKVPFDSKRAEMLLTKQINKGKHDNLIGTKIKERWSELDSSRKDIFVNIAGSLINKLPFYEEWPDLDF